MRQVSPRVVTVLAFVAFLSLGLPDALFGVAWPDIRTDFDLPSAGIGVILAAAAVGHVLASTFAGTVMRHLSLGWLLARSTGLVAIGLIGYASLPFLPWFPLLPLGVGLGSGAIDTGLNAYAAGHFSDLVMNWLHGFVGLGRMAGPLVMTAVLTSDRPWQLGYGLVGGFVMALAMLFVLRRHLWRDRPGTPPAAGNGDGQMERVSIGAASAAMVVALAVALLALTERLARAASRGSWSGTPHESVVAPGVERKPATFPAIGLPSA